MPAARAALGRCCGARRWVEAMLAARPFASDAELLATAERVWWGLGRTYWLEAFAAHPRIGDRGSGGAAPAPARRAAAGRAGHAAAGGRGAGGGSAPGRRRASRRYVSSALRHGGVLRGPRGLAVPSVRRDRIRDSRCRAVSRAAARQPVRLHDVPRQLSPP